MRLGSHTAQFCLAGIPLVGNLETGGIIGLTEEGRRLCHTLSERDVDALEVPAGCTELVRHLESGGYLDEHGKAPGGTRILSAYLHVTQRCNLSCRLCYSEDEGRNALPDPSLDDLVAAMALLSELGARRLVISGGEPFLRADLPDVARAARDAGIEEVVVLTNGLLVTERSLRPLRSAMSCVGVAFDGCGPKDTAHLRGSQRFERLVGAVRACTAQGVPVRIMPTLHAKNLGDLDRYASLARSLGASLGFSLLTGSPEELGDLAIEEAHLSELGRRAAERGVGIADSLSGSGLAARRSCGAGTRTLSVAADGTVYPCHMLHNPRLAMGNAFADSTDKIISSPVATLFLSLDAGNLERCGSCALRYLCGGGCRARAFLATGSPYACDPYCELSRSYYERVGELLRDRCGPEGGGGDAV